MAKDDLILMAEQGRMIGLLLLLYYYFQCLLKFCREEEASGSVVHVHSNKGISVLGRFLQNVSVHKYKLETATKKMSLVLCFIWQKW